MLKCGLLGEKLGHSYSPQIHGMLADYEYKLYERAPEELGDFLKNGEFDGLNVTIPYKKTVIPYCAELSDIARRIGSVNTIVRRADGRLYGDNTDAFGFEGLVRHSGVEVAGKNAIVLGSGGASVTACAMLEELGAAKVTVISRSGEYNYGNLERVADTQVIVNTTPCGMYPNTGVAAVDLRDFPKLEGVLDIVYNPARTALLLQAEELGLPHAGGLYMLVAQAKRSAELFMGKTLPDSEIARIRDAMLRDMQNIVLVGMPGSGKTTISEKLAERLNRSVYDSDVLVRETAGKSAAQIITESGEAEFRRQETAAIGELGKKSGVIIATGGGCITRPENYPLLHQNGVIFWLQRSLDLLPTDGRPLSQRGSLEALYAARKDSYARFADFEIDNNGTIDETVQQIVEAIG